MCVCCLMDPSVGSNGLKRSRCACYMYVQWPQAYRSITRRERGYEAHGGCVGGLKWMRARGSLAEAVSGCRYSRRSEGSGTEGSVVRNGVCIQRMWYCNLHAEGSYLEGPKAVIYRGNQGEGNRRYRALTA